MEFLQKSRDNLSVAHYCLEHGFYDAAVNRAYYAAFQAAVAALASAGITNEKNDHKWMQANFNGSLIKRRKIYPGYLKSYLGDMQTFRNLADYSATHLSKRIAREQLTNAEDFVSNIRKELEKS